MPISSGAPLTLIKKVMMFVDGGYLRTQMEKNLAGMKFLGDEKMSLYEANLQTIFGKACERFLSSIRADLIRIYYYDGESDDPKHSLIRSYHDKLRMMRDVQVKTIPMIKSSKQGGYKQKGIDTLIAIDMLSKAYENHYDVAYLLTGDSDLIPVINAVKDDAGKKVHGIYFESSFSEPLTIAFDSVYSIKRDEAFDLLL
ncbi:MAG: NYN domain-containing protein [Candidatus Bathyarchaeota archaeon]|nr:NYN domain-containing protein [Candidatus Bathyarchaeota archaeon]